MRFILGVIVGAALVYYLGGGEVSKNVKEVIHNGAAEVAKATEPSTKDRLGDAINNLLK